MTSPEPPRPTYFLTPADLGAWFDAHADASEVWVGLWKKGFERPGISYAEAVDEALCNGWIDSIVRRVDEASYMARFTPRRVRSSWTDANLRRVEELRAEGRLKPGGAAAYAAAHDAPRRPKR